MKAGHHKLHVEYFQGYGGKACILKWKKQGDAEFRNMDIGDFLHTKASQEKFKNYKFPLANAKKIPGDKEALVDVHPSYDLSQARPDDFLPKVGGMDFLADGRMVVSVWDASGAIYIIDGAQSGDPSKMSVKKIADGLAEPLGLSLIHI